MEKKQTVGMKILSVILGTLIGGFLFRCRGESGFGSSWGLYSVGLVIILVIYIFYGKRKGMKYELIPLGAFLTGLGVTGYATVIEQLSGRLGSDTSFFFDDMPVIHRIFGKGGEVILQQFPEADSELAFAPISIKSGLVIILLMGFTLVPFFAYFVGTLFSKKENKLQHYVIAVVLFFAVSTLVKMTIAHPILKAINPQQVDYALMSLKDRGENFSSMFEAYMSHFLDRKWTQQFQFVENYYMSIEHISDVFGVLSITAYAFIRKDVVTGIVSLLIDTFTSLSTTALSLLIVADRDTGVLGNFECPHFLKDGSGWGVWEFSTGAAIGFFTMLIIAFLPNKLTAQSKTDNEPWFKNNITSYIYNFVATVFVFGVVPFRVIGIRINKLFSNLGMIEEDELYGTIALIVASVVFGIYILKLFYKNIIVLGDTPFRTDTHKFSVITLSAYAAMCAFSYFFLNHACVVFLPYKEMTDFKTALWILTNPECFITTLMVVVFIVFAVLYYPLSKKILKKK